MATLARMSASCPAPTGGPAETRTPEGMTRHTLYIARQTAEQLDATAARLQGELGGLVPKHQILAAIVAAGIGQAEGVLAGLRTELLRGLGS